ncbi:hypothetical protein AO716_04790, partial [Arthrobacter sp. Edens01]
PGAKQGVAVELEWFWPVRSDPGTRVRHPGVVNTAGIEVAFDFPADHRAVPADQPPDLGLTPASP